MSEGTEFYVVACENMKPIEAVGPLGSRELAAQIVTVLKGAKPGFVLTIATRHPPGIPIMPAGIFAAELEAAIHRTHKKGGDT